MRRFLLGVCLCFHVVLYGLNAPFFQCYIEAPAPLWMYEQIQSDLEPFTHELSEAFLDQTFALYGELYCLTRVRVREGQIHFQPSGCGSIHWVAAWIVDGLRKLSEAAPLPDVDFLFSARDSFYTNHLKLPIFFESKEAHVPGILLPDRWGFKGYVPEKIEVLAGNIKYPWDKKIPKAFFRGSDTARSNYGTNWEFWECVPRLMAARASNERPDLIDAKLFYLNNGSKVAQNREEGVLLEGFVPLSEHPRYKYLIDLDGNCASCPRTAAIFHGNSVVLKEETPSRQWWYGLLKPYVHYIPISSNLMDLASQVEWAIEHDEECRAISRNAQKLVFDVLSEERIYQYMYELLVAYAERQKVYYE